MKEYYSSKEALVKHLIDNIPEYKEYWDKEKQWRCTNRTYHTEMTSLLHFVNDEIEHHNIKHLPFIFNLIEKLAKNSSDNAQNAVWTVFLEGLSNRIKSNEEKYLLVDFNEYLGPASIQMMKEIDDFWGDNTEELKYIASIKPFLLDSLYKDINDYKEFREENIKKWHEEGLDRPLPVEMVTLLEFVKAKLVNEDHNTIKKILDLVAKTAEYAQEDHETQKLLEHWYNILKNQK